MRSVITVTLSLAIIFSGCHSVENGAKHVINKAGEVVGVGTSELARGVAKGVDNTFTSEVVIAESLRQKGVSFGKYTLGYDSSSTRKNKLTIYLIFNKAFNGNISAKVFDLQGNEYGRANISVSGAAGEAKYADFVFDRRTDFERKSKFVLE